MRHPGAWVFLVLVLAAFRLTRLVGWDDITAPIRARLLHVTDEDWDEIRGCANEAFAEGMVPTRRYTIAKLVHCPWCVGFWISVLVWLAWLAAPSVTVGLGVPLALSAGVGLIAKNGDP